MMRFCRLVASRRALASRRSLSSVPASRLTYLPVDFTTNAKIEGEESQIATVRLAPGERIRAESGSMLYMTQGIDMETSSSLGDGMKRFFTGQNIFVSDFYYQGTTFGTVALGTRFPSKIVKLNLQDYPGGKLICQKGAYLASNLDINIEMEFTKNFQTGFFGGQGFVLQKLEGKGDVLLQAGGALVRKDLNEGESLRISSGCLVAFTSTVDYDVAMMPGFANVVFGGEGLFVTTLKGPGTVWLQGMPPDRMIGEIARRVPPGIGLGIPIPMGIGGGGGDATPVSEGTPAEGDVPLNGTETEGMVAANDVLLAGDRQSTVASSGLSADQPVDFESPNALFGDAGPSGDLSAPSSQDGSFRHASNESDSLTFEQSKMGNVNDDFVEQSTFSTNDEFSADFDDDDTTFSTFEGSNTGDNLDIGDVEGVQASGNSVLNTLWNMFTGGDD